MTDIHVLMRELLSLINHGIQTDNQRNRVKDLICYLSEQRRNETIDERDLKFLNFLLCSASVAMRTFGYNRLNNLSSNDNDIRMDCISGYYKTQTGFVLDRLQKEVLDEFEDHNRRLFLSAPTSFGKTFLLKEIIYRHHECYKNIVIVLPTVALLMEVTGDIAEFCKNTRLNYTIISSVYRDLQIKGSTIFVLTPERTLRLLSLFPELQIDFFFFDEIYKIDEDISIKDEEETSEKIIIGDENNNHKSKKDEKNHRAVAFRLALYFLLKNCQECYLAGPFIQLDHLESGFQKMISVYDIYPKEISFQPTMKQRYCYKNSMLHFSSAFETLDTKTSAKNGQEKLKEIVAQLGIDKNNQAIVYCLYPGYTESYSLEYAKSQEIVAISSEVDAFIDHLKRNYNFQYQGKKQTIDDWSFYNALKNNIGIHNGKYPKYFQREIMSLYNKHEFPMLFCTSTIVEGVNTNAKTVILYSKPSGDTEAGKRFLLLNINGRAGRYLHHFVGNIVYFDKNCVQIENGDNISLDFRIFSSTAALSDLDLENVLYEDMSENNQNRQKSIVLDTNLLPDSVFQQNRLVERKKQERILQELLVPSVFIQLNGIENSTIYDFIDRYFEVILRVWAKVGEIKEKQIVAIKSFATNYANNGYHGVLEYRFNNLEKYHKENETDSRSVNTGYREVFGSVKDTIEYQLPRIISLFESLINRAFEIKGRPFSKPLDLSKIIRYFEIGAKTQLGIDMIEKGVPIITVRKIEHFFAGDTLEEQIASAKANGLSIIKAIDRYELSKLKEYETLI